MITCNARFHQGDEVAETTGRGPTHHAAFTDAALLLPRGLRISDSNLASGQRLLEKYEAGDYGHEPIASPVKDGWAWLAVTDQLQPEISIGWVTFRFTTAVRLWAISAHVNLTNGEWSSSRQVPTFYLDPTVQGIVDAAHAQRIAEDVLSTGGALDDDHVEYVITAEPVY